MLRIQRSLFSSATWRCCFRTRFNFTTSAHPHQTQEVPNYVAEDKECSDLLPWLRNKSGAEISSVLTIGKSTNGRSLFASKHIQPGDSILKVPFSMHLAPDILPTSISSLLGDDINVYTKLSLVILMHQKLGQASEWAPYIRCLPAVSDMHSTILWSDEELKMIEISSLYCATLLYKAQIEKDFYSIKHVLDRFTEYFEDVTLHKFMHVYNLVSSRAWGCSRRGLIMIPYADFINHNAFSKTKVFGHDCTQVSEFIAGENYAPGEEVYFRYGELSNARILLTYGFIPPCNKDDNVHVVVNVPQHDYLRAMILDLLVRHTTPALKVVNDLIFRRDGFMVMEVKSSSGKGRGIPMSLNEFARVLGCTSPQELQGLAMGAKQNDGFSVTNLALEVELYEFLHERFSYMIGNYNAALVSLSCHSSPLSERHAHRMQLAQDLLTGELRILESASSWLNDYCKTFKGYLNEQKG